MVRASSHERGLAPQGWAMYVTQGRPVQSDRLVVPDGRIKLTRARNCTRGTQWSCDENRDTVKLRCDGMCVQSRQGRPVRVRDKLTRARSSTTGTRWSCDGQRDTMKLRLAGLFSAVSGTPGMLPPWTRSWHLGMSRPGAAGSAEARSWRGNVIRSGAGAILNNFKGGGIDGD